MTEESRAVDDDFPVVHDTDIVRRPSTALELPPPLEVQQLVQRAGAIRDAMARQMVPGIHYGTIPGTPKPTLLKPGAEKLCTLFHLRPHYEELGSVHRDNLIGYRYRCVLTDYFTGNDIAEGVGSCNSREKKYRKSDPWDIDNTILKMAAKRALVAAVLLGTAASDIFTDKAEKTRGELSQILNGRANDYDTQYPRRDGLTWQEWTRKQATEKWGYESRAECSDEELEELIDLMEVEITGGKKTAAE